MKEDGSFRKKKKKLTIIKDHEVTYCLEEKSPTPPFHTKTIFEMNGFEDFEKL